MLGPGGLQIPCTRGGQWAGGCTVATVSAEHQEGGFAQEAAVRGLGTRGIFLLKQMGGREHVKDH